MRCDGHGPDRAAQQRPRADPRPAVLGNRSAAGPCLYPRLRTAGRNLNSDGGQRLLDGGNIGPAGWHQAISGQAVEMAAMTHPDGSVLVEPACIHTHLA